MNWSWSSLPGFKSTKLRRSFDDQGSVGRSWVCLPPSKIHNKCQWILKCSAESWCSVQEEWTSCFIQKLQKLVVDEQEREFERAIIDRGKYRLQAQFSHLHNQPRKYLLW